MICEGQDDVDSLPHLMTTLMRCEVCKCVRRGGQKNLIKCLVLASANLADYVEQLCIKKVDWQMCLGSAPRWEEFNVEWDTAMWWKGFPSFAVSTPAPSKSKEYSLNTERFTFPLVIAEPKKAWQVWATKWCAERKVRVGAMRDENNLPLDVWSWCCSLGPFPIDRTTLLTIAFHYRVSAWSL